MFSASHTICVISMALSILSVAVSYRRKLWNRRINLIFCLIMSVMMLLCSFYTAIYEFLRLNTSAEVFSVIRRVMRVLLMANSGIRIALEAACSMLSILGLLLSIVTGWSFLAALSREEKCFRARENQRLILCVSDAENAGDDIYLKNCSLLL